MNYYSTNHTAPLASLEKAVTKGLAEDRGLYMPERLPMLEASFLSRLPQLSFHEIAFEVAKAFFGEDVETNALRRIVEETLAFDCPVVPVGDNIYSLELFHGPTLAFKDVGARFMARMLQYFSRSSNRSNGSTINVLVATSGDTGSAVANGFLGVEGIHVYVLYPKGKVSDIQESQFTTLGQNITALEIDGTFDDCQRLVKSAFMDAELCAQMTLTSANSINVARFLPQSFYYFHAVAQLRRICPDKKIVVSVPSGNFGNLCSALFGKRMGLDIHRFIAANNSNDVFYHYLTSGQYAPRPSVQTIANAMDVGDPSNFARIIELYEHDHAAICRDISGAAYSDAQIAAHMRHAYHQYAYLCDPHGACAYGALRELLHEDEVGLFLETAHPAKFKSTVDDILDIHMDIPARLAAFMQADKMSVSLSNEYEDLKHYLLCR